MNAEDLRALQAPFRKRYRENAQTAVVTLKASGELDAGKAQS